MSSEMVEMGPYILSAEEQKEIFELQPQIERAQLELKIAQLHVERLAGAQMNAILRAANRRGISTETHDLIQEDAILRFVEKPKIVHVPAVEPPSDSLVS